MTMAGINSFYVICVLYWGKDSLHLQVNEVQAAVISPSLLVIFVLCSGTSIRSSQQASPDREPVH